MTKRNVKWYEDRQDRAAATADRYGYRARKLSEEGSEYLRQAAKLSRKFPASPRLQLQKRKKAAALEEKAQKCFERAKKLAETAARYRRSADKYGRAKTRIGVYTGGGGWVDRDASRSRARRRRRRR